MGEVEKPFGCPQPGCGMSFINEDHLNVHQQRHDIALSINTGDGIAAIQKNTTFIDQTPTPTRFLLRHMDDGLFQEVVSLNPFDEQFRKASYHTSTSHVEIVNSSQTGSLETPRILPPVDSDETISSTSRDDPNVTTHITLPTPTSCITTLRQNSHPRTPSRLARSDSKLHAKHKLHVNISSAAEAPISTSNVISTPTPVITAGPSVTQSLENCVPTELTAETSVITDLKSQISTSGHIPIAPQPNTVTVPPSPSATVLQLVLKLPNGQAIPVEIPATPVSSSCSTISMTPVSSTTIQSTPSLAKLKLKQALASSSTAARPGNNRISRANTADRIAEMTRNRYLSGASSNEGEYNDDMSDVTSGSISQQRRRSPTSDDDPSEKRRKFLERNRAAAIRCREKKKRWMQDLASKSDELSGVNQKLLSEVATLRSEVATLKCMLLKHKDCPVTLGMQDGNPASVIPLPPEHQSLSRYKTTAQKMRTRSLSLPAISSRDNQSTPMDACDSTQKHVSFPEESNNINRINESFTPGTIYKVIPHRPNSSSPARCIIGTPGNHQVPLSTIQEVQIGEIKNDNTGVLTTPTVSMQSVQLNQYTLPKIAIHHRMKN